MCAATAKLLPVFRYAVKTLLWPMGFEVEVLNMSDSSNSTSLGSVDFLNRCAYSSMFTIISFFLAISVPGLGGLCTSWGTDAPC